jgi:SAM-dependent methyltransferase
MRERLAVERSVNTPVEATAFWDRVYDVSGYSRELSPDVQRALDRARAFFGPVQGRTLLDLGCGAGASSLFWARAGALVTAVDTSPVAIEALDRRCGQLGITTLTPIVSDAMAVDRLPPFDFVFGSMLLHHLEPFAAFARVLRRSVKDGGRAFFYENNASPLLSWFRSNVVGRFGVPKHGDADESPLTPREVDQLRPLFDVRVEYPEMVFFQLAGVYLLRHRGVAPLKALDDFLYRRDIGVSSSYRQYVMLAASP